MEKVKALPGARRVWSQQFTGGTRDLFALEDQVYSQVLQALQVSPDAVEAARTASLRTSDIDAYDDYLRGRKALRGAKDLESSEAAVQFFERALKKDPSFALAQAGLADASLLMYRETKDSFWSQRALAAATRASDFNDQLSEVQTSLGSVYLATGRSNEALVAMHRALELAPNSDEALRRLGRAYLQVSKHAEATSAFKKAIEVNPYFWLNHNVLGQAYLDAGDYAQALESFRRVTELEPENPVGYENVGTVFFKQGKWEECVPAYEKALAIQPYYLTYSNLGTAQFFLKRYDQAVATFEKAVALQPNDAITAGNLADALRWSSQKDRATPTYEKAIALAYRELQVNPREPITLAMLALYYAKTGDDRNALQFIKRARAVDRSDPDLLYAEAVVHGLGGRESEALRSLEEAFKAGYSTREAESDPELASIVSSREFKSIAQRHSGPSR
jgi:tetratricopeptide (TPR) repeat protein